MSIFDSKQLSGQNLESTMSNLKQLSRQMRQEEVDSLDSLRRLREEMDVLDLTECRQQTDVKTFGVLYLIKRSINEIWETLATDASFEFPPDPLLQDVVKEFGGFIESGLESDSDERDTFLHLIATIGNYYDVLVDLENAAFEYENLNTYFSRYYEEKGEQDE